LEETKTTVIKIPEAVGVFDSFEALQGAVYDLRMAGFSRYDLSMLGRQKDLQEKLGRFYWRTDDLEDNPHVPRSAFVSEEAIGELEGAITGGVFFIPSYIAMAAMAAAGGTIAATMAALAIIGTPAVVIGALLAHRVGQKHRDYYADQVEHGGILLWVRVKDTEHQRLATEILRGHSGRDVHVHDWSV
jgi:hypothetical protein